ncbi:hypothetical protein RvY_12104-2 [Ramazzottius varieornatus]|uniref:Peptidase M14 domain-containing protein n=1 Tax=Ramazzottius varieornatus TaxID=947166 RepID=A0A1D1VID9_RAMVA|nr:hypothetical protein RvY_12104-2 [Ramazzottius varieornatus]
MASFPWWHSFRSFSLLLVLSHVSIHFADGAAYGTPYGTQTGYSQQEYGPQKFLNQMQDPLLRLRTQIASTDSRLFLDEPVNPSLQSAASKLSITAMINRILPCQVVDDSQIKEPSVFRYHNYDELTGFLQNFSLAYPSISRLYSVGKSVQNRDLWVIEIGNNPGVHDPGKPEFKYVGNMHGNEVVGREILLNFIEVLLRNYKSVDCIKKMVDATRIHILPSMNPDGFERSIPGDYESIQGRANFHDKDLNRNFPDQYAITQDNRQQEPETLAVMNWIKAYPFVLSANLHGGSLVANYPFDDNQDMSKSYENTLYSQSPDDAIFKQLAAAYSEAHATMYEGVPCPRYKQSEFFEDGITNGAKWYPVAGGMQDWNYLNTNTFEITVELGCWKYPREEFLKRYWNENRKALFAYLMEVHKGIKGFTTDEQGSPLSGVTIRVEGIEHVVTSNEDGDYWRLLVPGDYRITAYKKGYQVDKKKATVYKDKMATSVNFTLKRLSTAAETGQYDIENEGGWRTIPATAHQSDKNLKAGIAHIPTHIPGQSSVETSTRKDAGADVSILPLAGLNSGAGDGVKSEGSSKMTALIWLLFVCEYFKRLH